MDLKKMRDLPAAILSDALNKMQCMSSGIKPLDPKSKLAGPAFTVNAMVGGNLGLHRAIYEAKKGDVLVCNARGHTDTSVLGFLQARASMIRGLAGVVIDGSIRDSEEIRESGFPVFCRGITPAGPHKGWNDDLQVPIQCGGVAVHPGDIIVGDADGVVVIPKDRLEEIYQTALQKLEKEKEWFKALEEGKSTIEILGLDKLKLWK